MHTTRCQSHSERQTADIAADLARRLPDGTVVLLFGDLGAGKTAFVRGFVEGTGIDPDEVSSPTFTIVQTYGGGRVQHVDLYRLGPAETDDLGLEELPDGGALVCIEWADRLSRPIPGAVSVGIHDRGGDSRELVIDLPGELELIALPGNPSVSGEAARP
ncbi:MAG: tRNA (adenosine(37)-N6)-threonylcarbamoyltransferase complex ATPase subunit type 1 TsaE [Acidobacteria bacterium]|nr:tRNA (adenosine(37)-N6)-threonylcarbamoyltransferase complex ATPase subunit type 1 TsaE [Acidobacteriota bacterium]